MNGWLQCKKNCKDLPGFILLKLFGYVFNQKYL